MITNNFINLNRMLLAKSSINKGLLPCKAVDGVTYYLSNLYQSSSYPYTQTQGFTLTAAAAGISLGTGTTMPTADDYNLESTITAGLTAGVFNTLTGVDENGSPYVRYEIVLKNTGSTALTIAEIGAKQSLYTATAAGAAANSNRVCLIDRTVFDTPITLEAGGYIMVVYTLRTEEITA